MIVNDLRYAVRSLLRWPGFTFVAVLTLALGIAANTAAFSLISSILLRPLPLQDPDRVVRVREVRGEGGENQVMSLTPRTWKLWRRDSRAFQDIAASTGAELNLTGGDAPERFDGASISANFFSVLGIRPILGRDFRPEESEPGKDGVVLLGHSVWQRRFGGNPNVLGTNLTLNGRVHVVIGVMPPALSHPYEAEMWIPLGANPPHENANYLYTPGRLAPGVSLEKAEADLAALASHLTDQYSPKSAPTGAKLTPLHEELVGSIRPLLIALLAAAGFVLLIACANVSNLLLARSLEQSREVAIRSALGASPGRLARLYVAQSLTLTLCGCAAGLLLAMWSIDSLVSFSPIATEAIQEFDARARLDVATLIYSVLAAVAVGIAFGLVPALRAARTDPQAALREQDRSSTAGPGGRRMLGLLVIAELAIALVLLVGAGLLMQSFNKVYRQDRGFDPKGVLTVELSFPRSRYADLRSRAELLRGSLERIRALPGVISAGATSVQPLFPGTWTAPFSVEGKPAPENPGYYLTHHRVVTPDYFSTLHIPLVQGRTFTEQDGPDAPIVVVVSHSLAERYWPGEEAVGKRVKLGLANGDDPWMTVIGVVGTLRETEDENLKAPDAWYLAYSQDGGGFYDSMTLVVRTEQDPRALVPGVSKAVWAVDPDLAVFNISTMEDLLGRSVRQERFAALLVGLFGALGLLLAVVGVYGVVSYLSGQRTREIGLRIALGASRGDVLRLVLRQGMPLVAAGVAIGVLVALGLTRLAQSLLFEVSATDPATFLACAVLLLGVAFTACLLPAARATRLDPLDALRHD